MSKTDILKKYISNLDGYKISNTHFKIGSKIHSSDFYYAKRLFQNSYYTSRISLKLALRINNKLKNKRKKITLVGYEMYSELILSLVKKFLNDFGYTYVNHCTTKDINGKITYLPDRIKINHCVIIIVPITSTGGTSKKIEEQVRLTKIDLDDDAILSYTVLQAYDSSKKFETLVTQNSENALISLETEWSYPENCVSCFDNALSKPLFETDKSSLTPTLIFNLPSKGKKKEKHHLGEKFENVEFKEALIYRRAKRNNEHFLFSTDTNKLIENETNKPKIIKWLSKVKKELSIQTTDKVVIISPSHYSNTQFINLVNEEVFNNSATIIHHQTDVDFLDNFKLLNQSFLSQKDTKIFFVDDSLISGTSFFKIYDLFRYANKYEKALNGAIFLSNKSSSDINTRVSRTVKDSSDENIKHLYEFVNVNLPIHPKISNKKPLEHEIHRYKLLSESTLHDAIRRHFAEKSKDLGAEKSNKNRLIPNDKNELRHVKMFKATHKVYEFFTNNKVIEGLHFNTLLAGCNLDKNNIEDKMALMKVLCQYPFLLYKPLRKLTFSWQKEWLDNTVANQKKSISTRSYTYNEFKELKFLIRRSIFLGNYDILSIEFIELINLVFDEISKGPSTILNEVIKPGQQTNLYEENFQIEYNLIDLNENEITNLDSFHIYLTKNYVEIFYQNGWCANRFLANLYSKEKEFITPQAIQFIRMIKIEAASVLNGMYRIMHKREDWRKLYKSKEVTTKVAAKSSDVKLNIQKGSRKNLIDLDNNKIENYLESNSIRSSDEFKLCNSVLRVEYDEEILKEKFINYLWLKQFLSTDYNSYDSDDTLSDKTDAIFQKMKALFDTKPGGFFIVNDGKDEAHLVYDKDAEGTTFLNELDKTRDKLLFQFMEGQNVSYPSKLSEVKKTIIEYEIKTNSNEWEDVYSLKKDVDNGIFEHEAKWLLLIRISDDSFKTLGLVGFYGNDDLKSNLLSKQLLMLIRGDLANFISKHHKNDAFSSLREAEAVKRFAYLAGHGRQMMQELADVDWPLFGPVIKTMEKLQYLFATKQISNIGNARVLKSELEKEIIKTFTRVKVNSGHLNEIINIGNEIYQSDKVENNVKLIRNLPGLDEFDTDFYFNAEILKFLCFELFINAKKNRFHFLLGNECRLCKKGQNELEIQFNTRGVNQLEIELIGSGPQVPVNVKNKINSGHLVKPDTEISGLYLVNKVIKLFDSRNTLRIESLNNEKCELCGYTKNKIKASLNSQDQ